MSKENKNTDNNDSVNAVEERISASEGLREAAKMFTNDPEQMVVSDDEVLAKMKKDLEKRIAKCKDSIEKTELEKELLILQILILQREKIDKEAAVILSDSVPFGVEDKAKEKKKKERDKKQKALIDKLNEFGISNLDIDVKPPKNSEGREKGGMERKQRIR